MNSSAPRREENRLISHCSAKREPFFNPTIAGHDEQQHQRRRRRRPCASHRCLRQTVTHERKHWTRRMTRKIIHLTKLRRYPRPVSMCNGNELSTKWVRKIGLARAKHVSLRGDRFVESAIASLLVGIKLLKTRKKTKSRTLTEEGSGR